MSQLEMKIEAAAAALTHVEDGMRLGIGTGSTADEFIKLLAKRVDEGLSIIGVPTSERTAKLCTELGVPLSTLEETPELDLTVDGADELDGDLSLIKGGGGALLREKIVAYASEKMVVIADHTKVVDTLGAYPLPIEVNPFGLEATRRAVHNVCNQFGMEGALKMRLDGEGQNYVTDGQHFIIDASFGHISDPEGLGKALNAIPGVVEHGLFIGLADAALIASPDGVKTLTAKQV